MLWASFLGAHGRLWNPAPCGGCAFSGKQKYLDKEWDELSNFLKLLSLGEKKKITRTHDREWGGTWDRMVVPWRLLWGGDPSLRSLGRIFHFTRLSDGFLILLAFEFAPDIKVKDLLKPACLLGCMGSASWFIHASDRRVGPTPGVPGPLFSCAGRQMFSCTFHLYDGLLRKLNLKTTESPSFAHTDTRWSKWVIVPE